MLITAPKIVSRMSRIGTLAIPAAAVMMLLIPATAVGEDWLQFRGNRGDSIAHDANPPTEWSADEIDWKIELPGRCVGGAIVVGDQVITTSSEGIPQTRLHVHSVDAQSGETRWTRSLWATGRTNCHPLSCIAAPTPASDGERIFAWFSSNDLVCLDLNGDVLWMRALAEENQFAFDDRGLATSPYVIGDRLIVQVSCQGDSFVAGINTASGETEWTIPLDKTTCWSTPVTVDHEGTPHALVQSGDQVMLVRPEDGSVQWQYETPSSQIPSPTAAGSRVFIPSVGMTAIDVPSGEAESEPAWQEERLGPERASAVVDPSDSGRVLVIRSQILTCGSVEDGSVSWRVRLEGSAFWASPLIANNHLYAVDSAGVVFVVDLTQEEGEIVSQIDMGEEMLGTPAISGDAIYLRGVSHLYKVSR